MILAFDPRSLVILIVAGIAAAAIKSLLKRRAEFEIVRIVYEARRFLMIEK